MSFVTLLAANVQEPSTPALCANQATCSILTSLVRRLATIQMALQHQIKQRFKTFVSNVQSLAILAAIQSVCVRRAITNTCCSKLLPVFSTVRKNGYQMNLRQNVFGKGCHALITSTLIKLAMDVSPNNLIASQGIRSTKKGVLAFLILVLLCPFLSFWLQYS